MTPTISSPSYVIVMSGYDSTVLLPVADEIARILIPCSHGLPPGLRTVELVEQLGGIQQGGGTAPRQTGIHPGSWHFH